MTKKADTFYVNHPEFDMNDGIIGDLEGYELTRHYVTYFWYSNKFYSLKTQFDLDDLVNELYLKFMEKNLFGKYNPQITSKKYHVMVSVQRSLIDLVRKQRNVMSLENTFTNSNCEDDDFSLLNIIPSDDNVTESVLGELVRNEILAVLPDYTDSKLVGNSPLCGACKFTMRVVALHLEKGYTPQEIAEFFYNPASGRHTTPSNVHKIIKSMRQVCIDNGYTLQTM